ncbi:MAG TPA: hypothetical protein VNJ11_11170, partial [Bryobacteraceae bacterium]|nr:hypothetical protein [Bryobacteraceae bacterium]
MAAISEAKLAANRANAQHSTGPKTPEGKARSAQNALKHGLTSRSLIVLPGEEEEFHALKTSLLAEVQPATTLEQLVFDQLLAAAWNLRRLRRLEAELFDGARDPLTDPALEARLNTLARYQARAERSFYRALKELRTLETQRVANQIYARATGEELPDLADAGEVTKRTHRYRLEELWADLFELNERREGAAWTRR